MTLVGRLAEAQVDPDLEWDWRQEEIRAASSIIAARPLQPEVIWMKRVVCCSRHQLPLRTARCDSVCRRRFFTIL